MRRILINSDLKSKVENFSKHLFIDDKSKQSKARDNLIQLSNSYGCKTGWKNRYIKKIIAELDDILKATPTKIESLCLEFDAIRSHNKIGKIFSKKIVKALKYKELRKKDYVEFASTIDINSCVYCNAQYTLNLPVEWYKRNYLNWLIGEPKKWYGTYDLDHVKPKSKYPFLAISFFNLIPSCPSCNRSKSDSINLKEVQVYVESGELDFIKFKIPKKSRQIYWETNNIRDIDIKVEYLGSDRDFFDHYMKTFKIQHIYNSQKDIVEELLHKKEAYTEAYKKSLHHSFEKLFPDKSIINRLIVGNYVKPNQVHKRPLSKFSQDISQDIGLIPKKIN